MEKQTSKKAWLDYLFYKIGKQQYDFRLSSLSKNGGEPISSKWHKFSEIVFPVGPGEEWKLKYINNRDILPIEVVIDLEDAALLGKVEQKLKEDNLQPFYVFATGSRGYHIHIFFKEELTCEEKMKIIKRYGGDEQKAYKTCIALEFAEHWKSGKIKELIYNGS